MPSTMQTEDDLLDEQLVLGLQRDLGPGVMALFDDDDITEVGTNPIGEGVWVESRAAGGKVMTDVSLPKPYVRSFLNRIADRKGGTLTHTLPFLEARLPPGAFKGARLAGQVEPIAPGPCFTIRIPPSRPLDLRVYLEQGGMTQSQFDFIRQAVLDRLNIFVVGGTNSGKTTLAMAILLEVSRLCPDHRIVTIEDTPELQVESWCWNPLYVHPTEDIDYGALLKIALRMSPDRIVIGESRGGSIVQLFDALLSGHPGGLSTFHADTVNQAFLRMLNYARRDSDTDSHRTTIGDAVDLMIVLKKVGSTRTVTEMVRVLGYDEAAGYRLEPVA
ncbi:MAG: ATPase, T2SS/T4P/T4SS family [Bacteroidota bacterium]